MGRLAKPKLRAIAREFDPLLFRMTWTTWSFDLGGGRLDLPTASLILRQHMALMNEGIGPRDPDPYDAVILNAAVREAGHLYTTAELHDFRLVDEDGTPLTDYPLCAARSWVDGVPCALPAGHPRIASRGFSYDHAAPDAGVWWNKR